MRARGTIHWLIRTVMTLSPDVRLLKILEGYCRIQSLEAQLVLNLAWNCIQKIYHIYPMGMIVPVESGEALRHSYLSKVPWTTQSHFPPVILRDWLSGRIPWLWAIIKVVTGLCFRRKFRSQAKAPNKATHTMHVRIVPILGRSRQTKESGIRTVSWKPSDLLLISIFE